MTDYAKKTVAELQEILKSRSLPHTGKKAELVARLNENDKEQAEVAAPVAEPEPVETVPEPEQQPTLSKPIDPVEAPAVPTQPAPSTDPSTATNAAPSADPSAVPSTFTANLSSTSLESELERRKARAARFGASATTDSNTDALTESEKAATRAARFGLSSNENTLVRGLDEALPERRERSGRGGRGRGHHRGGRGGGGGSDDRRRRGNTPRTGEKGQVQKQKPAYTGENDKAAAEARKKRFAAVA